MPLRASIDGTNSATYSYLADSPLVGQIAFASNGVPTVTTTKQHDDLNRLTSISSANASATVLDSHGYAYNSANQRTGVTEADGSSWAYGYDALGQVTSGVRRWRDNTLVAGQQFGYAFDTIGNRTSTTTGGDDSGANLRTASYANNALNQLTSRTVPGYLDIQGVSIATNTVTVNGTTAYRKWEYYREELAEANSTAPVWQSVSVAATGQSTITGNLFLPETPQAFTYDADGNTLTDGRWTYTWDGENRLVQMTVNPTVGPQYTLNFSYDAKGRRIQKLVSTNGVPVYTNRFLYDGWNLVAELNPTNVLRTYLWGNDLSGSIQGAGGVGGLLAENVILNGTNQTVFAGYDGNGNVTALVANNGVSQAQYEYGPFGEVIRASGPMAKTNTFRFSTKYQDDESDLLYYGYRYYAASEGRWLSRDPLQEKGGLNLYGFCQNDPVGKLDKDGRVVLVDDAVIIAAIGTLAACAAAEAWMHSPAGEQAIHDIAASATSIADAIIEGLKAARIKCERCRKNNGKCLPCNPPVGSIAYRIDFTGDDHNGIPTPHSHMMVVLQSPLKGVADASGMNLCKIRLMAYLSLRLPGRLLGEASLLDGLSLWN